MKRNSLFTKSYVLIFLLQCFFTQTTLAFSWADFDSVKGCFSAKLNAKTFFSTLKFFNTTGSDCRKARLSARLDAGTFFFFFDVLHDSTGRLFSRFLSLCCAVVFFCFWCPHLNSHSGITNVPSFFLPLEINSGHLVSRLSFLWCAVCGFCSWPPLGHLHSYFFLFETESIKPFPSIFVGYWCSSFSSFCFSISFFSFFHFLKVTTLNFI